MLLWVREHCQLYWPLAVNLAFSCTGLSYLQPRTAFTEMNHWTNLHNGMANAWLKCPHLRFRSVTAKQSSSQPPLSTQGPPTGCTCRPYALTDRTFLRPVLRVSTWVPLRFSARLMMDRSAQYTWAPKMEIENGFCIRLSAGVITALKLAENQRVVTPRKSSILSEKAFLNYFRHARIGFLNYKFSSWQTSVSPPPPTQWTYSLKSYTLSTLRSNRLFLDNAIWLLTNPNGTRRNRKLKDLYSGHFWHDNINDIDIKLDDDEGRTSPLPTITQGEGQTGSTHYTQHTARGAWTHRRPSPCSTACWFLHPRCTLFPPQSPGPGPWAPWRGCPGQGSCGVSRLARPAPPWGSFRHQSKTKGLYQDTQQWPWALAGATKWWPCARSRPACSPTPRGATG